MQPKCGVPYGMHVDAHMHHQTHPKAGWNIFTCGIDLTQRFDGGDILLYDIAGSCSCMVNYRMSYTPLMCITNAELGAASHGLA